MPDAVETMAYTNEVPWHGLGNYVAEAPSIPEMLKLAEIDWLVEKRPLFVPTSMSDRGIPKGSKVEVPGFFALTRDRDGKVLDVVGRRYTPVQNHEAMEFLREWVEAGDATLETAGSLRGGKYVWALARLGADFKLPGGDEIHGYLLIGIPHEQGKSLIIRVTYIRVVCQNTLLAALRQSTGVPEFRFAHRTEFDEAAIATGKETLGIARDQVREFEKEAKVLKSLEVGTDEAIKILAEVMAPRVSRQGVSDMVEDFKGNATPRMRQLMDAYYHAPGAEPGTGWGLLNAVTYYSDHLASRTRDKRLTNAWFGKTANQKNKVLNRLLEMAA